MNLATCRWDEELCRLFGVPMECLPEIRPTVGEFGGVGGVPLTAAVVDQQAALYGHGCRDAGDAKVTFGTGAFALAITGAEIVRAPERGLLPTVAWRIGAADRPCRRRRRLRCRSGRRMGRAAWACSTDLAELDSFAEPPAIERGLAFVPALSGLACPHWDRSAGALWLGMTGGTTRRDLCQALLEGVALRTAEVVAAMAELVPLAERLSIDGGLARSGYFAQFLADATGRTVLRRGFDELTAFGCAALAARGPRRDAGHAAGGQHPVRTARAECRGLARPIRRCGQPLAGLALSGTGAHSTCSIVGAPVASITSRSKPSAMPLAGGIWASAARKSSSSGIALAVEPLLQVHLGLEAAALLDRVGELAEAVGELDAAGIELEALGDARVAGLRPRQRRLGDRVLAQDRRPAVAELWLDPLDQHAAEQVRPAVVVGDADAGRAYGRGQRRAVGAPGRVHRGQQVDAGEAVERLGHGQPLGQGQRIDLAPAERERRRRRRRRPPRPGSRRNRPSALRRARRRDTIRAW